MAYLANYPKNHPDTALILVSDDETGGATVHCYLPASEHIGAKVAGYSRRRDARRYLRKLGYVQEAEGRVWKLARPTTEIQAIGIHAPTMTEVR